MDKIADKCHFCDKQATNRLIDYYFLPVCHECVNTLHSKIYKVTKKYEQFIRRKLVISIGSFFPSFVRPYRKSFGQEMLDNGDEDNNEDVWNVVNEIIDEDGIDDCEEITEIAIDRLKKKWNL